MLKPIPRKILTHKGVLQVPIGVDRYNEPTYAEHQLNRVNLQPTNTLIKTKDNKEVVLRSMLFFDVRNSQPLGLDLNGLKNQADGNNAQMKFTFGANTFTVESVDSVCDDEGNTHHYEIGLT